MKITKIELGDIFELESENGCKIFFQCVEIPLDKKNEIELIKVLAHIFDGDSNGVKEFFKNEEGQYFYNRFPLRAALRKKIVKKLINVPLPSSFKVPKFYRTTNFNGDAWQIIDAVTLKRETVAELNNEQKNYLLGE